MQSDEYPCDECGTYVPLSDLLIPIYGLQVCPNCLNEDDFYDEWDEVDL